MQAEILDIQCMEVIFCHMIQDFSETWNGSAWENIFFDPWITRMFFECADKVKQE